MAFGDVAYSGSRFIFWSLAPVLILVGVGLPFMIAEWNPSRVAMMAALSGGCFLGVFALYDARRFWWAARGVTGIVFCAYLSYLIYEVFFSGASFGPTRRSDASPFNSVLGFIVIGLPALWYTIFGRFSFRKPVESEGHDES